MKVILTISGLAPEYGGPSHSVPQLAMALTRAGVDVELIACEPRSDQRPATILDPKLVKTTLLPLANRTIRWWAPRNDFTEAVRGAAAHTREAVVHDNGLWLPNNHAVACAANALSIPLVISPRGMLTRWAVQHKRWKKWAAWQLYQRSDLRKGQALHATSLEEGEDLCTALPGAPISVVPNGIEIPPWRERSPRSGKTVLFLSRIHPKKGLSEFISAWSVARPAGWRVVLAGPSEPGYETALRNQIRSEGLENDFEFIGEVDEERKWDVYRRADLFVLPSHSENFGLVIAEALACGLPVITTRGTPWQQVITAGCGWWVEMNPSVLASAIREATTLNDGVRFAMGRRGRNLVEQQFGWEGIAARMIGLYESVLRDGRPSPEAPPATGTLGVPDEPVRNIHLGF